MSFLFFANVGDVFFYKDTPYKVCEISQPEDGIKVLNCGIETFHVVRSNLGGYLVHNCSVRLNLNDFST
jgi:hypothetical protein